MRCLDDSTPEGFGLQASAFIPPMDPFAVSVSDSPPCHVSPYQHFAVEELGFDTRIDGERLPVAPQEAT